MSSGDYMCCYAKGGIYEIQKNNDEHSGRVSFYGILRHCGAYIGEY